MAGESKISRQVIIICLIITIAFVISVQLFFATSSGLIYNYTERLTNACTSEVGHSISKETAGLNSLLEIISQDHRFIKAIAGTEQGISSILKEHQSANDEIRFAYVSRKTGIWYGGNRSHALSDRELSDSWVKQYQETDDEDVHFDVSGKVALDPAASQGFKPLNPVILAFRLQKDMEGKPLGILAASLPVSVLENTIERNSAEFGINVFVINREGQVVLSGEKSRSQNKNLFAEGELLAGVESGFLQKSPDTRQIWLKRGTIFSKEQSFCVVSYLSSLDQYLVVLNNNARLFTAQRQQMATLSVIMLVILMLIVLMITFVIQQYRQRIIQLATTDVITGLSNRKSFMTEYGKLEQEGKLTGAVIFLLDIDYFKKINDSFGHLVGDQALAAVAEQVRKHIGFRGIAGRWGGDEFIGVIGAEAAEPYKIIRKMIEHIAESEMPGGLHLSVSIGAARLVPGKELNQNVEAADEALYQSKKNGRGFLTVYQEGLTPKISYTNAKPGLQASDAKLQPVSAGEEAPKAEPDVTQKPGLRLKACVKKVLEQLTYAVEGMIPFVAGGGILIAVAFLIDGASVDVSSLSVEVRKTFGSITPLAAALFKIGGTTFNFMLPVFSGCLAYRIAGKEAVVAGFIGGYISSQGSAGFAGAILSGFLTGYLIHLMKNFLKEMPKVLMAAAPILIYPIFSLLFMDVMMIYVINPLTTVFNSYLFSLLESMASGSKTLLGALSGAMMATDMGGPINKAAYHFGTAGIKNGMSDVMAAVMIGGMVPPCGIALSSLIFPKKYTQGEKQRSFITLLMGLAFITEGALPYLITDFPRVLVSCMAGAAVAGALSELFGCALLAPHGGIFVFPVVEKPLQYLAALTVGSVLTAVILGLLKKEVKE